MRVLITGGGGFIGSQLVLALLKQGDEVVVFDLAPCPAILEGKKGVTYVRGDCGSEIALYNTMVQHKIEGVMHLGALLAGTCEINPPAAFQVNFRSTQVLLDASVALGVKRFFFMSSISIFDPKQPEPVPNDGRTAPPNIYGQTKLAGEHLVNWYAANHGLTVCGIRPTWVWGPNRQHGITAFYTTGMLNNIAGGGKVVIDNAEERGDWLYVYDCIKAIMLVWNAPTLKTHFYNICGGCYSLREVANIAIKYCPDTELVFPDVAQAPSPYAVAFDDSVAQRELGWQPDFTIESAVKDHLSQVLNKEIR